jgi:hypothetical protein
LGKIQALAYYKQANYMDCRLSAYPYNVTNNGNYNSNNHKAPQIIDFIMLDLDLNNFKYSRQKLDKALHKILSELKHTHDIMPTVIWSGNGYHVLVSLEPLQSTLENMAEFAKFKEPSKYILRFLEKRLSAGKSDSVHNNTVSFGNCMLRVPSSFNAKHQSVQVQIIKKWNGQRLAIKPLLGDFIAYLLDLEVKMKEKDGNNSYNYNYNNNLLSKP